MKDLEMKEDTGIRLKPSLIGGMKKADKPVKVSKDKEKPAKAAKTDKVDKKTKKTKKVEPAAKTAKAPKSAKAAKPATKAGAVTTFTEAVSKPVPNSKVDFSDTVSVANAILFQAAKAFNSKHDATKIAKSIVSSVAPEHKKAVAVSVTAATGDLVRQGELAKVARKVDSIVSSAVKAALRGKLDKPALGQLIAAALSVITGGSVKKVSSKSQKAAKPAKVAKPAKSAGKAEGKKAKPSKKKSK